MSRAQKMLETWAYANADQMILRVRTLPDEKTRADALHNIMESMKAGSGKKLIERTAVFTRLGNAPPEAIRKALAEVLMQYTAHVLNDQEALGDTAGLGDTTSDTLDSVSGLLSSLTRAAMGVYGAVATRRDARRERSREHQQWLAQQEQSVREFEARQAQQAEERAAARERQEREEALAEEEYRITARERERELALQRSGYGTSSFGRTLLILGGVGAAGASAYFGYKYLKNRKR